MQHPHSIPHPAPEQVLVDQPAGQPLSAGAITAPAQLQADGGDESLAANATRQMQIEVAKFCESFNKYGDTLQLLYTKYDNDHPTVARKRTCIINNTQLYLDVHLPASQRFMEELRDVMCNYTSLDFADFEESVLEIAESAEDCAGKAELVRDLHAFLADDVEATLNMDQTLADLDREFRSMQAHDAAVGAQRERQEQQQTCFARSYLAPPSLGINLTGLIVPMVSGCTGDVPDEQTEATAATMTAARQQLANAQDAAAAIAGPIRQCVSSMIGALTAAVRLFNVLNAELQGFKRDAEQLAKLNIDGVGEEGLRSKLMQHYHLMKAPAKDMEELCMVFDAAVIRTDVKLKRLVVNSFGHESYIKAWLRTKLRKLTAEDEHSRRAHFQLLSQFKITLQGGNGHALLAQPSNSHDSMQASHSTGAGANRVQLGTSASNGHHGPLATRGIAGPLPGYTLTHVIHVGGTSVPPLPPGGYLAQQSDGSSGMQASSSNVPAHGNVGGTSYNCSGLPAHDGHAHAQPSRGAVGHSGVPTNQGYACNPADINNVLTLVNQGHSRAPSGQSYIIQQVQHFNNNTQPGNVYHPAEVGVAHHSAQASNSHADADVRQPLLQR